MFFKLEHLLNDAWLPDNDSCEFVVERENTVEVVLKALTEEDRALYKGRRIVLCIAEAQITPSAKNQSYFDLIESGNVQATEHNFAIEYTNKDGLKVRLPRDIPSHFSDFLKRVDRELSTAIAAVTNAYRWRSAIEGPPRALASRGFGFLWSSDRSFWHPTAPSLNVRMESFSPRGISQREREDIERLVDDRTAEPLGHELFREAWAQRNTNPRSSIIVGIVSLEVAVKNLIANLAPDAAWLAVNVPSPPLLRLLTDFLPTLKGRMASGQIIIPPPEDICTAVKNGVSIRNTVAHVGGTPPKIETLEPILLAIKDLLWLFDFYSGEAWAYDFIRSETRNALKLS
ncbi:hypothetical protein AWB69_06246 [Caballeronia udeis]|uniref:ApeA N-terminal domain-containing protein n=1 Tax=Caballeronia udeis TaxID=1232866 RepID=A0A158IMR6_9BURK|nr:hypothetical protein [Caballeronia udeis]SAL57529.1 hypothetical protein AWB69_06246 [Caballeronia udeis]